MRRPFDVTLAAVVICSSYELVRFVGPFSKVVQTNLTLTNPTTLPVCFKVKTTAPNEYSVRPNAGVIHPKESMSVTIMLHMIPSLEDKNKHKFMVQSAFMSDTSIPLDNFWKSTPEKELMDTKLRVLFDWLSQDQSETTTAGSFESVSKAGALQSECRKLAEENKMLLDQLRHLESENMSLRDRIDELEKVSRTEVAPDTSVWEFKDNYMFIIAFVVVMAAVLFGLMQHFF
ncbi:Vesicle associated membrane protein associated [Trichuris trichiura]|uniref:Major sperm protein n=1 Tax=Trichuris trichiura TaxID=36087 RepID=A0A077ZCX0_TRITR|nr:Vesicle associated membrane protein associated [Trichuris trichiura]